MADENKNGNDEIEVEFVEPVEPVPDDPKEELKEERLDSFHKFCDTKDPDGTGKCKINLMKFLNGDMNVEKFKEKFETFIETPEDQETFDELLTKSKPTLKPKDE